MRTVGLVIAEKGGDGSGLGVVYTDEELFEHLMREVVLGRDKGDEALAADVVWIESMTCVSYSNNLSLFCRDESYRFDPRIC